MLEEVNDQVAQQNQKRRIPSAKFQAGGHDFHDGRRQHEPGAQCDEIFEITPLPVALDDDGAAENVRRQRR